MFICAGFRLWLGCGKLIRVYEINGAKHDNFIHLATLQFQFEVSLGNAGNMIDGQVQSVPTKGSGGSTSGGGDNESAHSVNLEEQGTYLYDFLYSVIQNN